MSLLDGTNQHYKVAFSHKIRATLFNKITGEQGTNQILKTSIFEINTSQEEFQTMANLCRIK